MNTEAIQLPAMEFMFGDQHLHARFATAIELLARLVATYPKPVALAALAEASGQSRVKARSLLACMRDEGLISPDSTGWAWSFNTRPEAVTLADVFRSVTRAESLRGSRRAPAASVAGGSVASQNLDLLLMQATMAVNQVVMQHLRAFDLGRLKAITPSAAFHALSPRPRHCVAEPEAV